MRGGKKKKSQLIISAWVLRLRRRRSSEILLQLQIRFESAGSRRCSPLPDSTRGSEKWQPSACLYSAGINEWKKGAMSQAADSDVCRCAAFWEKNFRHGIAGGCLCEAPFKLARVPQTRASNRKESQDEQVAPFCNRHSHHWPISVL